MSSAIPTMTSMYANPAAQMQYSQYAAQPTMTSMYATPGASMYMPAQTMAAPQMVETVQAAPVAMTTVAAPSYVAAPQMVAAAPQMVEVAGPQFGMPQPQSLTAGMTAPAKLEAEQAAYAKALEAQLNKQSTAVLEEAKIKKKMLDQQAKTQLEQTKLQVEENLKMALLQVDQEAQTMLNGLQEAAITQRTSQEEGAAIAIADYKKKEALEQMSVKSYTLQKQWFEKEANLQAEYQKVMQQGSKAAITPGIAV